MQALDTAMKQLRCPAVMGFSVDDGRVIVLARVDKACAVGLSQRSL